MQISVRQIRALFIIILSIAAVVLVSCGNDVSGPEPSIYGSWVRLITDSQGVQFNAEMDIKTDGSFDFILLQDVPGHTNTSGEFTLDGDVFTVGSDKDCNSDGVYKYTVTNKELTFVVVQDACAPRVLDLQGTWSNKAD